MVVERGLLKKHVKGFTYPPKIPYVLSGDCRQTIREGNDVVAGDTILFHGWKGKPRFSEWTWRKRVKVESANPFLGFDHGMVLEDGTYLPWTSDEADRIASLDYIDPPNGQVLKHILEKMHGLYGQVFQIIRWDRRPPSCSYMNCEMIGMLGGDGSTETPGSTWCHGVRKGALDGKVKAHETTPSDVFVECWIIGDHSDQPAHHIFVTNIPDAYLELVGKLNALKKTGRLKRALRTTFNVIDEEIVQLVRDEAIRNLSEGAPIEIGTKFIEFRCDCGEIFFREYNHDQPDGEYYVPDKEDLKLFGYHIDLGHSIHYIKAKRVRRSRGDNQYWQQWGPTPFRFR